MTDDASAPRSAQLPTSRSGALWFIFVGPVLTAFFQQQAMYALVEPACASGMRWLVFLPLFPGLALMALAVVLARREWRRGGEEVESDIAGVPRTARFFAMTGLGIAALSLALIIALSLPTLLLDPCQR